VSNTAQNTQTQNAQSEGFFSSLARKVGLGSLTADATATTSQPVPAKTKLTDAKAAASKTSAPKADTRQASAHPPKPAADAAATVPPTAASAPVAANEGLVAGAQPIVSANSFESRFSAAK
jgi:hypothetical protein